MLAEILSNKQIRTDQDSLQHWGKDWTNGFTVAPSAVVFPETIEQLQELVRYAISAGVKLVPSGGRTGLSGGAVASNGEVVVSFDRMNKILDFSEHAQMKTNNADIQIQCVADGSINDSRGPSYRQRVSEDSVR